MRTKNDLTLVDVIEHALETDLTVERLDRITLHPEQLQRVAFAVEDFYRGEPLPPKAPGHLRPFIPVKSSYGLKFGLKYAFGSENFTGEGEFRFVPQAQSEISANAKRLLLYAHSLSFHDTLPGLLDYFRFNPHHETSKARLPAVVALLREYAEMRDLLRNRIVIPLATFADDAMDGSLSEEEKQELSERLQSINPLHAQMLASYIKTEQARGRRLDHRIDLFLPSIESVEVLGELLRIAEDNITTAMVREPFYTNVFASVPSLNSDAVSVADIIRMRNDDEIFAEWRSMLLRVLSQLYEHRGEYTDLEAEFRLQIRDQIADWNARLGERRRSSSALAQILGGGEKISIGVIAGAVTGVATGDPTAGLFAATASGAAAGVIPAVFEMITNLGKAALNKPNTTTIRNHFLAINPASPV
jgi:hypothetical protein